MSRQFRSDDPQQVVTGPEAPVVTKPRPVREFWTADLQPTTSPAKKADAKPTPKPKEAQTMTTKPTTEEQRRQDARDRLKARQDEAAASMRQQWQKPTKNSRSR